MEVDPHASHRTARHRRYPAGRVVPRRLVLVLTPAVLTVGMLVAGALTGAVPVALALEGRQPLTITVQRVSTEAFGTFPSFVQNPDGSREPVVVLDLRRLRVAGLCASTRVDTPVGTYVLRATTPPDRDVTVGAFQFALQGVDGLDALGRGITVNRDRSAPDGTPIDTSTGGVPFTAGGLTMGIDATARWATVNQLDLAGSSVQVGRDQRPCA